jgi:Flp pilus assembly CpaF family ATPase
VSTDFVLLRRLQHQLGALRQQAVEDRRTRGLPALRGDDARQHSRSLVQRVVAGYAAELAEAGEPELCWEEQQDLILALEARLFGAGNLQQLLEDPEVEDIDINGFDTVFVGYADGSTRRHDPVFASNEDLVQTVQVLAGHEGLSSRPFDTANPRVNLRLPDGSRLYAVQGVTEAPAVSIRRHRVDVTGGLKSLVALGSLDEELADFLRAVVLARKNVMIAGETGSGKTTLLRAVAREIDPTERIITVERSLELGLDKDSEAHPNAVAMEERPPNTEGLGAVSMADLVRDTLRLNPSRVIVGEVLGEEVVTMLNAMSQGNDGSLSTIHSTSSLEVVHRIALYAIQAPERLPWPATVRLVAGALDFVVFLRKERQPPAGERDRVRRFVDSIREIHQVDQDDQLLTTELWSPSPAGPARRNRSVRISDRVDADLRATGWRPADEPGWV